MEISTSPLPSYGGLLEAGVRSVKYHIKRVAGKALLKSEEFTTLLNQIEAVLNSRPLSLLPSDLKDPIPLTPLHFLIGRYLMSPPDPDLQNVSDIDCSCTNGYNCSNKSELVGPRSIYLISSSGLNGKLVKLCYKKKTTNHHSAGPWESSPLFIPESTELPEWQQSAPITDCLNDQWSKCVNCPLPKISDQ